jgi:hypothetical protein
MSLSTNVSPANAGSSQPRNALLHGVPAAVQGDRARAVLPPAAQAQLLKNVIGHAAVLSDTPGKWAGTIALLKQNGVDPAGYEDFNKGRPLAIAASGVAPLPSETAESADDDS